MKKFNFELAPVLRWRESVADQERQALDQLQVRAQALQAEHDELRQSLRQAADLLALSGAVEAAELAHMAQFKSVMQNRETRIVRDRHGCNQQITEQRSRCTEADRAQELLRRLKGQRLSDWERASDREIESNASELYLAKWVRTRRAAED